MHNQLVIDTHLSPNVMTGCENSTDMDSFVSNVTMIDTT